MALFVNYIHTHTKIQDAILILINTSKFWEGYNYDLTQTSTNKLMLYQLHMLKVIAIYYVL